jgi:hypothetical protein
MSVEPPKCQMAPWSIVLHAPPPEHMRYFYYFKMCENIFAPDYATEHGPFWEKRSSNSHDTWSCEANAC